MKEVIVRSGRELRHTGATIMHIANSKFAVTEYLASHFCECLELGLEGIYEHGWSLVAVSDGVHYFEREKS